MAEQVQDWHLERGNHGDVVLVAGADRINLGPRDEAFVRMADFMADGGWVEQAGFDEHEDAEFGVNGS